MTDDIAVQRVHDWLMHASHNGQRTGYAIKTTNGWLVRRRGETAVHLATTDPADAADLLRLTTTPGAGPTHPPGHPGQPPPPRRH